MLVLRWIIEHLYTYLNNDILLDYTSLDFLVKQLSSSKIFGEVSDTVITLITFDSRKALNDTIFVAIKGTVTDGHQYLEQAYNAGCRCFVVEDLPEKRSSDAIFIRVADSSLALAELGNAYYGFPSREIQLVGITGTNGKSTTVMLQHQLFTGLGYKVGLLSTIENRIGHVVIPATHTTPEPITLNKLLREMVNEGCEFCFMEVSSHALVQNRIAGLKFKGAIFSNITHDHLDYHGTFKEYIFAKKKFFDLLDVDAFALVNKDDRKHEIMLQNSVAKPHSFALSATADFEARLMSNTVEGLELRVDGKEAWFSLVGEFNASNLLAVYASACLLDEDPDDVLRVLTSVKPAKGRFEQIHGVLSGVTAVVDYAHTPDALENVLQTLIETRHEGAKIITVFGCGGDRDRSKRSEMGLIALNYSDQVFVTSDNPRSEDPMVIINEIMANDLKDDDKLTIEVNRAIAIEQAVKAAGPSDIVLVAGKGHETYQEIKGERTHFDDIEEVKKHLS